MTSVSVNAVLMFWHLFTPFGPVKCSAQHTVRLHRYLKRIDDAVNSVKTQTDGAPVTLLAHSAGGWLSRVYLLSKGTTGIDRLVTIGSPHSPPPQVQL